MDTEKYIKMCIEAFKDIGFIKPEELNSGQREYYDICIGQLYHQDQLLKMVKDYSWELENKREYYKFTMYNKSDIPVMFWGISAQIAIIKGVMWKLKKKYWDEILEKWKE